MKRLFLTVALCGILVLSAGCGGDKTIKTDEGTLKVNDNKVEVTTNDGGKSQVSVDEEKGVSLPEGYPGEVVPVIDGGKIVLANKNEDADKKVSFWVSVTSDKPTQEVYKFYEEALKDATQAQKTQSNDSYYLAGLKGGMSYTISIDSEEKDGKKISNIQIFAGQE